MQLRNFNYYVLFRRRSSKYIYFKYPSCGCRDGNWSRPRSELHRDLRTENHYSAIKSEYHARGSVAENRWFSIRTFLDRRRSGLRGRQCLKMRKRGPDSALSWWWQYKAQRVAGLSQSVRGTYTFKVRVLEGKLVQSVCSLRVPKIPPFGRLASPRSSRAPFVEIGPRSLHFDLLSSTAPEVTNGT